VLFTSVCVCVCKCVYTCAFIRMCVYAHIHTRTRTCMRHRKKKCCICFLKRHVSVVCGVLACMQRVSSSEVVIGLTGRFIACFSTCACIYIHMYGWAEASVHA
jgi:hypothetical protein